MKNRKHSNSVAGEEVKCATWQVASGTWNKPKATLKVAASNTNPSPNPIQIRSLVWKLLGNCGKFVYNDCCCCCCSARAHENGFENKFADL